MKGKGTPDDGHGLDADRNPGGLLTRLGLKWTLFSALATRGTALFAGFAVTYMIGHKFGAAATGQYALVTQTAMFLAVAGLLGLDVSVVRHLSKSVAEQKPVALKLLLRVLALGLGMMLLIALGLVAGGEFVWRSLFGDVVGPEILIVLCLLVLGRGGAQLLGGLLRSQHRFATGLAVMTLFIPAAVAIALATGMARDVNGALWAAAFGGMASIVLGLTFLAAHVGTEADAVSIPMKAIVLSSLPLWGAGLAQVMGEWYGLAVAARLLGPAEAGLFRVSFQIAGLLLIVSFTLFSVYSAKISTAFHAEDREEVARLARSAVIFGAGLAAPLALAIVVGGEWVLSAIGPEFVAAYPVLLVLVLAQLLIALSGPGGLVLAMAGDERTNLAISLAGTGILVLLAPVAASTWGLMGLTTAIAIVLVGRNLAAYALVRSRIGIGIWSGKVLHPDRQSGGI